MLAYNLEHAAALAKAAFMAADFENYDHVRTGMHRTQVMITMEDGARFEMFCTPNTLNEFLGTRGESCDSLIDGLEKRVTKIEYMAAQIAIVITNGKIEFQDFEGTVLVYEPVDEYEAGYLMERDWAAGDGWTVSSLESSGPHSSSSDEEEEEQEEAEEEQEVPEEGAPAKRPRFQ